MIVNEMPRHPYSAIFAIENLIRMNQVLIEGGRQSDQFECGTRLINRSNRPVVSCFRFRIRCRVGIKFWPVRQARIAPEFGSCTMTVPAGARYFSIAAASSVLRCTESFRQLSE